MRILFLAALAAVCTVAQADPIASMPNNAGGKIVLTNEDCTDLDGKTYQGLFRVYTFAPNGVTNEGCYYLDRDLGVFQVSFRGENGAPNTRRVYPTKNFTVVPSLQKQSGKDL